jgi:spore maturation protein CgeB
MNTRDLKVLVVGRVYDDAFASLIGDGLREIGCLPSHFDPAPGQGMISSSKLGRLGQALGLARELLRRSPRGEATGRRRLLKKIEEEGPFDLVLCTHDFLMPRVVAALKAKTGAPVVLWHPDAVSNFGRHMFVNAPFDAVFLKDPYLVDVLRRTLSMRVAYLPECFSPRSFQGPDVALVDDTHGVEIVTIGNAYAYRLAMFTRLTRYRARIWGNPPPLWAITEPIGEMFVSEYVTGRKKAKIFSSAKIALNSLHPAEIWGINARAFEIAGAGGFQLIDWRPGLSQLFEDGTELVSFRDFDDLIHKINHYLPREVERRSIAAAGQRRAMAEHTYRHRLETLLDTVFGDGDGFPTPRIDEWQPLRRPQRDDAYR